MKHPSALDRRYPYLCKVLYFPTQASAQDPYAPRDKETWLMRCFTLPRKGDVVPHGHALFTVTTAILEDCCSANDPVKLEKQAKKAAEKAANSQPQVILWVEFWGVRSA
ncbi:MAG: hypothetical protein F6J97_08965 [Leptolyngbya sp. SIO4C1]|nr:hypothetical protein [Leptolyngbya sp. SIO4C1]